MQGQIEDLCCSLEKMKEALSNVMPEWEEHIQVSSEGNITVHNSYTNTSKFGYHIRIPEGEGTGLRYCDFGMKQLEDGTWQIDYDSGGLPYNSSIRNPVNALKNEIAAMTMKEKAEIENLNMIQDDRQGKVRKQVIRMTPEEATRFLENA
jgi:hypothetical protein